VLKDALKVNPSDTVTIARLIDILAQKSAQEQPAGAADLDEAKRIAAQIAAGDAQGHKIQALAIGFQRAHQPDLAYPYAEAAAKQLDTPGAHLAYGDLLLSIAEGQHDEAQARAVFTRAVEQYDIVLKSQPKSVEAVNNKAWILHMYLGQSQQALEL